MIFLKVRHGSDEQYSFVNASEVLDMHTNAPSGSGPYTTITLKNYKTISSDQTGEEILKKFLVIRESDVIEGTKL